MRCGKLTLECDWNLSQIPIFRDILMQFTIPVQQGPGFMESLWNLMVFVPNGSVFLLWDSIKTDVDMIFREQVSAVRTDGDSIDDHNSYCEDLKS